MKTKFFLAIIFSLLTSFAVAQNGYNAFVTYTATPYSKPVPSNNTQSTTVVNNYISVPSTNNAPQPAHTQVSSQVLYNDTFQYLNDISNENCYRVNCQVKIFEQGDLNYITLQQPGYKCTLRITDYEEDGSDETYSVTTFYLEDRSRIRFFTDKSNHTDNILWESNILIQFSKREQDLLDPKSLQ